MGMGNRNAANGSMIAGMGGFGCMLYNATGAAWDAPAAVDGLVLTAGNCLYLKAASVTILSGTGIMYYGYGQVAEAGGE